MGNLLVEKKERICVVSFNRPESLNALNSEVLAELNECVDKLNNDKDVDVIILTGAGKAFVAGADICQMKDMNSVEARKFGELGQETFRKIELLDKPVIAAVNGFALGGGCELAMSCDIRIASTKAKFGQPEVGLGITPGFSGTQRLPRIVGIGKAKELIYTANIIGAEEAEKIGLANCVVEPEELMDKAMGMAKQILKNGQWAVRFSKSAINTGMEGSLHEGILVEKEIFALCFATKDQKEGMDAFVSKRKAEFKGE